MMSTALTSKGLTSTAVVGAGLAGLACARRLVAAGAAVTLFDKGRAPGGRVATRRADVAGRAVQFDHGAQYVSRRGEAFRAALATAPLAAWPDPERSVGVPGMSAVARHLAAGLACRLGCEITAIAAGPGGWTLRQGETAHGPFATLVIAVPAPQAVRLLADAAPALPPRLGGVRMAPCWTAMAVFPSVLPLPDSVRPGEGPLGWAARDSAKPARDAAVEAWVVQAAPAWSRAQLEATPAAAATALLGLLEAHAGTALPAPLHLAAHRWRYAAVERPLGEPFLWDAVRRLGLAGDWCLGARAEAAFDSGDALAAAILG